MKYLTNKLAQFKQWILSIVMCCINHKKKYKSKINELYENQPHHNLIEY